MAIRVIIIAAEVLIDLLFLLRFYGVGRQRIAVLASEFLHRENAHRTFKFIYCHPFVRAETVSFENPVGTLDVDKRVGAHFLVALVPENLLGKYSLVVHVENCHVTVEAPQLVGLEIRCRIGLYRSLNIEQRVELLQKQPFGEFPERFLGLLVYGPEFCSYSILSDTRIAYKSLDVARNHRWSGFGVDVNLYIALWLLLAANNCKEQNTQK